MTNARLDDLEIGLIHPHPDNVRRDTGNVNELAASIRAHGILEPLVVAASEHDFGYTLIAGHRRLEAAKKAKLATVPCRVLDAMTKAEAIELMLIENLQRSDITPIEEASAYQVLLEFDGYHVDRIRKATGRSAATIRGRVKLMTLPDQTVEKVHKGQISLADAATLAEFVDEPSMVDRLTAFIGTSNFAYYAKGARSRAKAIEAARAAGAEVFTDRDVLGEAWPERIQLPYDTPPAAGLL